MSDPTSPPPRAWLPSWLEWRDLAALTSTVSDAGEMRNRDELKAFFLASLQMQNLVVLTGSGTSLKAGAPSMGDLWRECTTDTKLAKAVFTTTKYGAVDTQDNIEELLSRCDSVLQISDNATVRRFKSQALAVIVTLCRKPDLQAQEATKPHREFLRRLARRRARDTRLKLFTTNYDRCFEMAAGALGLVAIDGFSFSHPRRFDPRFFDYDVVSRPNGTQDASAFLPGVFHYYKLHGSIDWKLDNTSIVIDPNVDPDAAALIYPASTKFKTSYQQPHLELMAQYLASLRQPNTCLLVVGFGFADDHLNEPIFAALETNPHLRVPLVSPRIEKKLTEATGIWGRFAALAANGADIALVGADFDTFVSLVPDLRALNPAERLARAVAAVVK